MPGKTNCVDDFSLVCLCNLNLFTPPNEPNLFDFITGNANDSQKEACVDVKISYEI
jgi:hypothetical protein